MPDIVIERTHRLAKFLRAAVAIKSKPVTEVNKYPYVIWFGDLAADLDELRSPLLQEGWPEDDFDWLAVKRVQEPVLPDPPAACGPWLADVPLNDPERRPSLNPVRFEYPGGGSDAQEVPLPTEVAAEFSRFLEQRWDRWAAKTRIARAVTPTYRKLFAIVQELKGKEDAFDLFLGVGLLHSRVEPGVPLHRHILAFPAEIELNDTSGVIRVGPSLDRVEPRVELDFVPANRRSRLEAVADRDRGRFLELWPDVRDRPALAEVLASFAHSYHANAEYLPGLKEEQIPDGGVSLTFAPALVLRPKGTRSLDQLLAHVEAQTGGDNPAIGVDQLPNAWRRIAEDGDAWGQTGHADGAAEGALDHERVFFPLPCNEEQIKVVRYARGSAGVVVQGPPGTGKSHTIANLISHYLASGQRVLVTAQSPQALSVLRDKMPEELRDLCVCLLGNSRQSEKDLQRSVKNILARRQEHKNYDSDIAKRDAALERAELDVVEKDRRLTESRASETTTLEPIPGYRGTKASIATRVSRENGEFAWIGTEVQATTECPQHRGGWQRLADYHSSLTEQTRSELARTLVPLPFEADRARAVLRDITQTIQDGLWCARPDDGCDVPLAFESSVLVHLAEWLAGLAEVERGHSADGWWGALRSDLLSSERLKWATLRDELTEALAPITDSVAADTVPVEISGRSLAEAHRALAALSAHYEKGGQHRVLFVVKPKVVKECEWVEDAVHISGIRPVAPEDVDRARRACEGWLLLSRAWQLWGEWGNSPVGTPRQQRSELLARHELLEKALRHAEVADSLDGRARDWLLGVLRRNSATESLSRAVRGRLAACLLADLRQTRDDMARSLDLSLRGQAVVPALLDVGAALAAEDEGGLNVALEGIEAAQKQREQHRPYLDFIGSVERLAPQLAADIRAGEGTASWHARLTSFEAAWTHARAAAWLRDLVAGDDIDAVERAARDQRQRAQDILRDLVADRAWSNALKRIQEPERASLVAWTKAVAAIPATGATVFHKRAVARTYLSRCLDAIPAWVVSLGRLYETVDASPGLFDIAIVDEASQCWLDSLLLLYLAKKVIIVGDDKQISPTVVGVRGMEIADLANTYLHDLSFRGSFTLESSLFDLAQQYLPHGVPLREHFRCVPEIIRFSNELSYPERPLIPLRSVGGERLEPLKLTYVSDGLRKGNTNDKEAAAIAEAVEACHHDPAYEGADFGVMCLQGDAQAKRIEQMILDRLGPAVFQERDLRCGNPYAFQGDERDVMFLSMVAAPNFPNASLTGTRYEQRFNVAMSRGRDQLWLFHSIDERDLGPTCLRRKVLQFFRTPPDETIGGVSPDIPTLQLQAARAVRSVERPPRPFDSWFEVDVALALAGTGFRLSAQVAVGTKRIDLVIEGPDGARLAVECDGDAWHGPEQYEQDVFRQRQLERVDWRFARVRESVFRADQRKAVEAVVAAAEEQGIFLPGAGAAAQRSASVPRGNDRAPEVDGALASTVQSTSAQVAGFDQEALFQRDLDEVPGLDDEAAKTRASDDTEQATPVAGSGPFTGYEAKDYPDPRSAPPTNVRRAILDIVEKDGPLPKQSVYRLYREGCPRMGGVGKVAKKVFNSALYYLERRGDLESRDEGDRRLPAEVVVKTREQPWVRVREAGARGLEDVPLSELAEVARNLDPRWLQLPDADRRELLTAVLRRYGAQRIRQTAVERMVGIHRFERRATATIEVERAESQSGQA